MEQDITDLRSDGPRPSFYISPCQRDVEMGRERRLSEHDQEQSRMPSLP